MMQKSVTAAIGLATLGLAVSYASTARWNWVIAIVLAGLLWSTELWHGYTCASTAGLVFYTAVAIVGVIAGVPVFWLFSSLVAALVAWDLSCFAGYLHDVADVRNKRDLISNHYRRLGVVAGLGWSLGVVTLSVQLSFNFVWTLALGLAAIISLSQVIRYVRRESD
jgi:hypothetical protein